MARVAKQTVYTPKTIMQLLNQWDDHRPVGMNVPHNKTLRMYALPDSGEEFKPNAAAMYGLLDCLKGSMRQHVAGTRANYNSFMSMFSRWKKDFAAFQEWREEITEHKRVDELQSKEFLSAREALDRPVTGWISYEAWLQILGKAGVLDPAVIAAIPRTMQSARENMARMTREWMELEDKIEPDMRPAVSRTAELPGMVGKTIVRGGVTMPEAVFDVVATIPEIDGVTLDGLAQDNSVFTGYSVTNDVRAELAGRVFVNCIFRDVTFRGGMDGVTFIACDFEGECRIASGVSAENMLFKKCATPDGVLVMKNLTLTGLRMYQCPGFRVDVSRACVSKSHIVDGWVDCGRKQHEKGMWEQAPRVAPRTIHDAVWESGGLLYDVRGVAAKDLNDNMVMSAVLAALPSSVRMTMVKDPGGTGAVMRCGEAAELLFEENGLDTRELSQYQWEVARNDELVESARLESLRLQRRGTARAQEVERERHDAPANPLEEIVLKG